MEAHKSDKLKRIRDIGFQLRRWRLKSDATQETIADILDIHRQSYAKIENGKTELTILKAIELAEYYHISIDELVNHKPVEAHQEVQEPTEKYSSPSSANLTFVIGGEGKNSEEADRFLERLGKLLMDDFKPDDTE